MHLSQPAPIDRLIFGNSPSEISHHCSGVYSVVGGNSRVLSPVGIGNWEGERISFDLEVDPVKQNYFSAKFDGDDVSESRMVLLCEGKQVGYRHLGDVDLLDAGSNEPPLPGRFYLVTNPIPLPLTKGKKQVHFEIRSNGPIWGYGSTWAQYQKPMVAPTRRIFEVASHVEPFYTTNVDHPAIAKVVRDRTELSQVVRQIQERVGRTIDQLIAGKRPLNQMEMQFLAHAYSVRYTHAYHSERVIERVRVGLDALCATQDANPKFIESDGSTPNPGWFGFGPAGDAIWRLGSDLIGRSSPLQRERWSKLLTQSVKFSLENRRWYTNQTMIIDLNAVLANNGLRALGSSLVVPHSRMVHLLYEAIGLEPWLGSYRQGIPDKILGDHYFEVTRKGLTKELGFVGYYGEVIDWMGEIYDASRINPEVEGDARVRTQWLKIIRARSIFRYPVTEPDGTSSMRIEALVGWRDEGHYPGDIAYVQRSSWDGSCLDAVDKLHERDLTGFAQQMVNDGQLAPTLVRQMSQNGSLRVTNGLLHVPVAVENLQREQQSSARLPMSGKSDFVWADPEDGVVAIKHGDEFFYASLYWRARNGVNSLGRIHFIGPKVDRIAVVAVETQFQPSAYRYVKPNWTNFDFGNGGLHYPDGIASAHAGTVYPVAAIPNDVNYREGDENPYAGRAEFYVLRYGPYSIAMNATSTKSFPFKLRSGKLRSIKPGETFVEKNDN